MSEKTSPAPRYIKRHNISKADMDAGTGGANFAAHPDASSLIIRAVGDDIAFDATEDETALVVATAPGRAYQADGPTPARRDSRSRWSLRSVAGNAPTFTDVLEVA